MGAMASQITSLTIIYQTVYSGADQRKHQSSASMTFVRGIHRWPVNSPRKWPVTWKMFSLDDVIMFMSSKPDLFTASLSRLFYMYTIVLSHQLSLLLFVITYLIARFMGPTWGQHGVDRTQMGPMLAPWTLLYALPGKMSLHTLNICYHIKLWIRFNQYRVRSCRDW